MSGPETSRSLFDGRIVRVMAESWPGHGELEVVHQLGAAAMLPITPEGLVLLVRQFRPAIGGDLVEIPAGLLDVPGEDALSCAERELLEETGYRAEATVFLGGVFVAPGSSDHYVHLFATRTSHEPVQPREAGIGLIAEPLDRMVKAARSGRVRDAKTALALLLATDRVGVPWE